MRDFLPSDVRKREYVIGIIKEVYESYGFEPLETPAVENIETLTGKYGEEGNQLIFKILKRGEKLDANADEKDLADLALRYDLTVPLARVVANHKNDLPRFFKRYQIQPVWRADRPARGRYREFYQCDVDAIGSSSMIVEAELCAAVSEILTRLGFNDFVIRVNHREVLRGILDAAGIPSEKHIDALIALDKIDKIGREGVEKEFKARGLEDNPSSKLLTFLEFFIKDKTKEILDENQRLQFVDLLKQLKYSDETAESILVGYSEATEENSTVDSTTNFLSIAIEENLSEEAVKHVIKALKVFFINTLRWAEVNKFIEDRNIDANDAMSKVSIFMRLMNNLGNVFIRFDPSLARGLSYYTGAIFEINVPDLAGSLGGGGRYDGLIGMFGKEEIPACGFSLGLERILVVMEERGMFPKELTENSADVLVTIWNEETIGESLKLAGELRKENLRVLIYPEADKLAKQFKYAGQINVPFVCVLGETELAENKVTLKNMQTGEQELVSREYIASKIKAPAL